MTTWIYRVKMDASGARASTRIPREALTRTQALFLAVARNLAKLEGK